jgi:hypothetical protein
VCIITLLRKPCQGIFPQESPHNSLRDAPILLKPGTLASMGSGPGILVLPPPQQPENGALLPYHRLAAATGADRELPDVQRVAWAGAWPGPRQRPRRSRATSASGSLRMPGSRKMGKAPTFRGSFPIFPGAGDAQPAAGRSRVSAALTLVQFRLRCA